jgi:hypothetical protein
MNISAKTSRKFLNWALFEIESEGFNELPHEIQGMLLEKWAARALPNGTADERDKLKEDLRRDTLRRDMIAVTEKLERAGKRVDARASAQRRTASRSKPKRPNPRYKAIYEKLKAIAEARPRSHDDVFRMLNGRVGIPHAEPFETAGGWLAGFRKEPKLARSWLSKVWKVLHLPPFPRGPK